MSARHLPCLSCATCSQEQAKIFVYDPQVKREDMWIEMDYTCGVNHDNTPKLDESVITATTRTRPAMVPTRSAS